MDCVAVCCIELQCVAVCCSVLQCVAVIGGASNQSCDTEHRLCCSVLQCVAVCCSVLQCVAVIASASTQSCNTEHSDESCLIYKSVMPQVGLSHIPHMNASHTSRI